jgi:predicted  nucleic acid-binding Zn-ribbon protein
MPGPAVIFREVHRLRRHARDLEEQIGRVPRQLKAQQAKAARQEGLVRECQEAIKHLKVQAHEKEVALKATHGLIAKHQKQLNEAASKKEYDALRAEIDGDREKCRRLEDEILAGWAEREEREAQLPELEKALRQAREEHDRFEEEAGRRRADLAGQLNDALGRLAGVEATVPETIRPQYARIVGALGADALAPVRDRTCSACHTEITAQNYNELQQEMFVACKSCGRILYLPE